MCSGTFVYPPREVGRSCFLRGGSRRMSTPLWEKEAGEEEKGIPLHRPLLPHPDWNRTESSCLSPTSSFLGVPGFPSQVPSKLLICFSCWPVADQYHLTNGLQRLRMKTQGYFGEKPGDRASSVKAEISAVKGNPNQVPTSSSYVLI